MTSKVDLPPSHIDTNEVLVITRDHRWAHWSPQPMVEVEGSGVAALRDSRWAAIAVPRGGVRLTFFCWDLLIPRFVTYSVVAHGGEALVYDPGARMPWSRPVVRRLASDPTAPPIKVPKVRARRLTLHEVRRGILLSPHRTITLPIVGDRG